MPAVLMSFCHAIHLAKLRIARAHWSGTCEYIGRTIEMQNG